MPTKNVKVPGEKQPELYSFEFDGETYTFEKSLKEILKPVFIRKNRHRDEADMIFTMLEEVAGDDALAAIDEMELEDFAVFSEDFGNALKNFAGTTLPKS